MIEKDEVGEILAFLSEYWTKIKNDPDMLKLGGERKRLSVMFSDIAGFTSFTDQADPAEVQSVLEEYFAEMTSIVFANKGIVDKYYGDIQKMGGERWDTSSLIRRLRK